MKLIIPNLSRDQWRSLAVFEAMEQPTSIDLVGAVAPLSPAALIDFLDQCQEIGLLKETKKTIYKFNGNLHLQVLSKIATINTSSNVSRLIQLLHEKEFWDKLPVETKAGLLVKANWKEEAAVLESEMAREAIKKGAKDLAREKLRNVLEHLSHHLGCLNNDTLYVDSILDLSRLTWILGKGMKDMPPLLIKAIPISERLGDRRSKALILCHLGLFYYYADRRLDALNKFREGLIEIEDLGDDDILNEAAPYLGYYYFIQGKMKDSVVYWERAFQQFESLPSGELFNVGALMGLPYASMYLGQFNRAIGYLDFTWRWAKRNAHFSFSSTIQAALGVFLLKMDKRNDALEHLNESLRIAAVHENHYAQFHAEIGMAYYHSLENRHEEAREWLVKSQTKKESGIVRQFSSPYVLELLYELDVKNLKPIPDFNFVDQCDRIMQEPNIHLQGTALRLKAKKDLLHNGNPDKINDSLMESRKLLEESGDMSQLAKTHIELAFLSLNRGEREKAISWAQLARIGLSGHLERFFPDSLRTLLDENPVELKNTALRQDYLQHLLTLYEELPSGSDINRSLNALISELNRYFGAERGGLFWIKNDQSDSLYLRAFHNMSKEDVRTGDFKSRMVIIKRSFGEKSPLVMHRRREKSGKSGLRDYAVICLPIKVGKTVRGILYYDNSYLDDCFDTYDESHLQNLSAQVSILIENLMKNNRLLDHTKRQSLAISARKEEPAEQMIVAGSQKMIRILDQADQVAESDSTILLTGETGVGKELLARRIHENSHRHREPMITIDPTTIPENLVESELFGHEKGAFTGADRQKPGWIELADKGTLFIDEIGEIPPSLQIKLLRVIQEKTFFRVGGCRTLASDFRLIVATNRNLADEVAAGRFRKDLYFRINIVELTLPPLKNRKEDIGSLALHFLKRYARKYNRSGLKFRSIDIEKLVAYPWPGNIRELQNIIERAVILSTGEEIEINLPTTKSLSFLEFQEKILPLAEIQRRYIKHVLEKTNGRVGGPRGAAELLGMKRTSFYTRMKTLGMRD